MKMIYIVYRGCCPCDEVVGVLSSRSEAKLLSDSDNEIDVLEFPLDAIDDLHTFEVELDREGSLLSVDRVDAGVMIDNTAIASILHPPFSTFCWAKDEASAIRIAKERFRKLISDNDGSFPDKGYFTIDLSDET